MTFLLHWLIRFSVSVFTAFCSMLFPRRVTTSLQTSALKSTATWCNYWNRLFSPQTLHCTLSKCSFIMSHRLQNLIRIKWKKNEHKSWLFIDRWESRSIILIFFNPFLCLSCVIDGLVVKEENQVLWERSIWRIQMGRWRTQRSFQVSVKLLDENMQKQNCPRRHKLLCCQQVHADDSVRSGRRHSSLEDF